ncbi:MAG TPA: TPM domain-containing protein [Bacillota bacterium]|nr:TPM domain-containing protein [Bacillota bacterium]
MWRVSKVRSFFTKNQKGQIVQAIGQAEDRTSGEIRVHVESNTGGRSPFERAKAVFETLGMTRTELRNGVLIYLAVDDHKFAIIGDAGIDRVVPSNFWEETKEIMRGHFAAGRFLDGVLYGIESAGEHLKTYFPCAPEDVNELTDEISEGD